MMTQEEQKAYNRGYETYQQRRGGNIYPCIENSTLWDYFEAGWLDAYNEKAEDTSADTVQRLAAVIENHEKVIPALRKALEAAKHGQEATP